MVEAGGQFIRGFRCGLDYAFIPRTAIGLNGCGACYAAIASRHPSARSEAQGLFSESMSLYRAGLKLAFFLPLGVTMPLS